MNQPRSDDSNSVDFYGFYHLIHQFVVQYLQNAQMNAKLKQQSLSEVGFRIGRSVIEKITEKQLQKFKMVPNTVEGIPQIKFICKEFWTFLFQKSADEVSTDRKGTFYMNVFNFTMFQRLSSPNSKEVQELKQLWYAVIKGLLEGAMKGLAYPSSVTVEPLLRDDDQNAFKIFVKVLNYPVDQPESK